MRIYRGVYELYKLSSFCCSTAMRIPSSIKGGVFIAKGNGGLIWGTAFIIHGGKRHATASTAVMENGSSRVTFALLLRCNFDIIWWFS